MLRSYSYPIRFFVIAVTMICTSSYASTLAENVDMYELGKKVYMTGPESCQNCHGAMGTGTSRSKVNLTEPTTWKAFEYQSILKDSDADLDYNTVAKAVISLGGRGWNERHFAELRNHLSNPNEKLTPFDEDMVGLKGPSRKVLLNHVKRLIRKSGLPKASQDEIEDLLSASVLTYIKQEFVD